jgi:hypothetical protein
MKLGTEDKQKVYALAVLGVIALYVIYSNFLSDSTGSSPAPKPRPSVTAGAAVPGGSASPAPSVPATAPRTRLASSHNNRTDEFHPRIGAKRQEEQINYFDVDPTLRLDLLVNVQNVKLEGGQRNLFQFGKIEPPTPVLDPKLAQVKVVPQRPKMDYPRPYVEPPPPPRPPPPPPPPAPTMKYYGLATKRIDGKKTAFFLDGEDILLATEGMVLKKKFRVVRINPESVIVEDVDAKYQHTVRLSEDAGGS